MSDKVGQRKTPANIPSGYALDNEPNDAPNGKLKCDPNAGWIGDAIVNPSRFRNEAKSIAGIDKSLLVSLDCMFDSLVDNDVSFSSLDFVVVYNCVE